MVSLISTIGAVMFYVYESEYGFAIDVRTTSKATFEDFMFAWKSPYFKTSKEAFDFIAATYPQPESVK
jgi:hypothetical protein